MRPLAIIVALLILPLRLDAQVAPAAGTYSIWFCAAACEASDTAMAPLKGYLVLQGDTLRTSTLPEAVRARLADRSRRLLFITPAVGSVPPNACFSLEGADSSFWFLQSTAPGAFSVWEQPADSIAVRLSASPDAFHTLRAAVQGERLLGVVRFHGFIVRSFDQELGSVHGFRIGPPDISRCAG